MLKTIIFITSFVLLFTACSNNPKEEKWTAFIYPDKQNTKRNVKSPMTFSSLEECQKAAIEQINNENLQESAIFKCGLNCNFHEGMKVEICEKMID